MAIFYALFSAFSFGTADFLGGLSSRKNPVTVSVFWSQGLGLLTVLAAAPLLGAAQVHSADVLWGIAGGLCGGFGIMFLFQGLSTGIAAIVSPSAALTGAVLPVLFGILTGERPPLLTWAGVVLSLPAILLLSYEKGGRITHISYSLRFGLISGVAFGGFFILLSRTADASGLWPLAAARFVTVPLFLLISVLRRTGLRLKPGTGPATWLSGFLDMAANVFYLLAFRTGYLIAAVVLTALYPAPTVLLQRLFLHERLTWPRTAGLLLSITGAALIGIGG
jgi:drug/metabolite transporter (DMT)-like permease